MRSAELFYRAFSGDLYLIFAFLIQKENINFIFITPSFNQSCILAIFYRK